MKIFLFCLLPALLAFSCGSKDDDLTPDPGPSDSDSISYLALGDSYTIGQSVPADERFPEQLADSLRADSFPIGQVRIIAKTGWTTKNLQDAIASASDLDSTYGLVSLLIGVNNQYQGRTLEEYKTQFTDLLNRAVELAGGRKDRVFVVSIPDYAYTPFGGGSTSISAEIDEFNAANKSITTQQGIRYFNITPTSRKGLEEPGLVASDGLHPSGEQYRRWVSLMLGEVGNMLE